MTYIDREPLALILAITAVLSVPQISQAQVSDDASISAIATLQSVAPPLAVEAGTALNFGTVSIPNGSQPGNICRYIYRVGTGNGTLIVAETDESDINFDTIVPTPSFCDKSTDETLGTFEVDCVAASDISYTVRYTTGSAQGVRLSGAHSLGQSSLRSVSEAGASSVSTDTGSLTTRCPTDGTQSLEVGGTLFVDETAEVGAVTAGVVTLEASY